VPGSEQNDEECDATDDDGSNKVWFKKYLFKTVVKQQYTDSKSPFRDLGFSKSPFRDLGYGNKT